MINLVFSLFLIVILYFLKNIFEKKVLGLVQTLFVFQRLGILIFSLVYLPSTILHEGAHYLACLILKVPVSNFSLLPKIKNNQIILGSVTHASCASWKQTIISLAPALWSIPVILLTLFPPDFFINLKPAYLPFIFYFYLLLGAFPSSGDIQNIKNQLYFLSAFVIIVYIFLNRLLPNSLQMDLSHFFQIVNNILFFYGIILLTLVVIIICLEKCLHYLLKN